MNRLRGIGSCGEDFRKLKINLEIVSRDGTLNFDNVKFGIGSIGSSISLLLNVKEFIVSIIF